MRILRRQSNLEVSSTGFALFVVGLVLATFIGGAARTVLSSNQVHERIVRELRTRFPKHEFEIGGTEVLLSRGIWPGLGLRLTGVSVKQDLCGKLSFLLTLPEMTLPLDLWSLRVGRLRLDTAEIKGGQIHLDYHSCLDHEMPPPAAPIPPTSPSSESATASGGTSIRFPSFDWEAVGRATDGLRIENLVVTYEKNPTWKLLVERAALRFGEEFSARANVEIERSLPFGQLSHEVQLEVHGDKGVMQWNVNTEYKEGQVHVTGSVDLDRQAALVEATMRQVPIKDLAGELVQMGLIDHDLNLKATWVSCGLKWEGQLTALSALPISLSQCRIEGGYGRAELAQADLWLTGDEYFKVPAKVKVAHLQLQPLVEALNREVLPAVISRLGSWSGEFQFSSPYEWGVDGSIEGAEVVFSNQSTRGKQTIDSLHTELKRGQNRIVGTLDHAVIHEGDFAGQLNFSLSSEWRDGEFQLQIERISLSPAIQKLMLGGEITPLSVAGRGVLQAGELHQWQGVADFTRSQGEGWSAHGAHFQSSYRDGKFRVSGTVKQLAVEPTWRYFSDVRDVRPNWNQNLEWRDLVADLEIDRNGGLIQSVSATEVLQPGTWKLKGNWVREGEFNAGLSVIPRRGRKSLFTVHGEKGLLRLDADAPRNENGRLAQ